MYYYYEKKKVIARATESTSHSNCHSVISSILDLSPIVKLLVEDAVFDYQSGRKSNTSKFLDLYFYRTKSIVAEGPLDLY